MADCVIRPVPLGEMMMDRSMVTYRLGFGQRVSTVGYVWYIEGAKDKILVDAGFSAGYLSEKRGIPAVEIQSLESGLEKLGLSADDIDIIILTHLHSDHVAEAHKFLKAKFFIQQDELEFARNPHPTVAGQYPRDLFEGLDFEVIDGDVGICDEVSVIKTPGHTVGGQSVKIKTAEGTAIISGLCSLRENFDPPEPFSKTMSVFPFGVFVNLFDMYDNLNRIKEEADIVIPIHDPQYMQESHIP